MNYVIREVRNKADVDDYSVLGFYFVPGGVLVLDQGRG